MRKKTDNSQDVVSRNELRARNAIVRKLIKKGIVRPGISDDFLEKAIENYKNGVVEKPSEDIVCENIVMDPVIDFNVIKQDYKLPVMTHSEMLEKEESVEQESGSAKNTRVRSDNIVPVLSKADKVQAATNLLWDAIKTGDKKNLYMALREDANVELADSCGNNAFMQAIVLQEFDIAKIIYKHGVSTIKLNKKNQNAIDLIQKYFTSVQRKYFERIFECERKNSAKPGDLWKYGFNAWQECIVSKKDSKTK